MTSIAYAHGFSGIAPMSESIEYVRAYVSGASDAARFYLAGDSDYRL